MAIILLLLVVLLLRLSLLLLLFFVLPDRLTDWQTDRIYQKIITVERYVICKYCGFLHMLNTMCRKSQAHMFGLKHSSGLCNNNNTIEIQSHGTAKDQNHLSILCCHEFVVVSWISLHRVRESDQRDFSWISERQWNCNAFCSNRINNCSSNTRAFNSTHLLQTMCNNGHHFVVVVGVVVAFVVVAAAVFCVAWQTDRLTDR